jgi:hypothetical protein
MKTIVRKTEEEMRQDAIFTPIKVKDYSPHYDYWECDIHKVIFEAEDIVLLKTIGNDNRIVCPLKVHTAKQMSGFCSFSALNLHTTLCRRFDGCE